MKGKNKFYVLTALFLWACSAVVNAQNLTTIGEIKQLKGNTDFTVTFAPNTVQVIALEKNDLGNVGGTYLWDGKDGLFLFNDMLPSWPINDLRVGDYISGTLSGKWEYTYWDVYNADGDVVIGNNAPLVPLKATGQEIVENGAYNKFGLYQITGTFNKNRLQFLSDDGVLYHMEDNFRMSLPEESSHGTLTAMFYQGDIANYLWPVQADGFVADDVPFVPEATLETDVVYNLSDLKKCLTSVKLVLKDGYKIQVLNSLGSAYFLWDGTEGLLLHDGARKIADKVGAGMVMTGGTLFCETRTGFYGVVGHEDLTVEQSTEIMAPIKKSIATVGPADIHGYLKLYGQIEKGEHGHYKLTDGESSVVLADRFEYGTNFENLVGKKGYVQVIYHFVGNRFVVYPEDFFTEDANGLQSVEQEQERLKKQGVYTIDGRRVSHPSSQWRGLLIENGRKVVR